MSVWEYLDKGTITIWKLIFQAFLFGGLMSWTIVTSHIKALKKQGPEELTDDDYKVRQSAHLIQDISIREIYDRLKNDERTRHWKLKLEDASIVGTTKISRWSRSEKITISNTAHKISIESKPTLCTAMWDNGKNRGNVRLIKGLIEG